MKTCVVFVLCSFALFLSACSSGDSGLGTGPSSTSFRSTFENDPNQTFPGGDCFSKDSNSCLAFKATNIQRLIHGLEIMSFCEACYDMALEQSYDMGARGYFDHQRPDESFAQRAARFNLSKGAGENIAWGKVGAVVVDMWMNSAGHRANILNPKFNSFAIGTYGLYTTQVFYVGTDR